MALVLVVADDSAIQARLADIVQRAGYGVSTASCCHDALEEVAAQSFVAVLVSVQLPDGSGLALLPRLRQSRPYPEVILMSRSVDGDEAERAIKSGAWDYVEYPSAMLR